MRYLHFILAFVASIVVSACATNDVDAYIEPVDTPTHGGDLQVVGRITQYSDCDVATRSKKEGDESKVTSMGLALFPIENGTIGNCVYYDFKLGGSIVFIVDRHDAVFNNYVDKEFAMYIFANMQEADGFPLTAEDGKGMSLEDFTKCAAAASENVKDVPANGFPMMGSLGNTVTTIDDGIAPDGKTLVLKPTQNDGNVDGLPLVNGTPTDNLEIPLKSMYAKFSFTISVDPDQEIIGNKAPRFDLVSYEVHNIPKTVDSNSATNSDSDVKATSGEVSVGSYAQGATTATFDFYLPERYLSPTKTIDEVLPDELKSASQDEYEKYRQRYKNKLVDGKAATYVTINGKYTDHQGHTYDVSYNIYLGGNNYDDFNIIRNTHYDNSITIRGISASDDQSANDDGISIDWRVNVERSTPLVINLRRESLLDAHYEVRPMRLRLVGDNIPNGTSATVAILNEDGTTNNLPNWIRLEASSNTANHITSEGSSKGKRKYFTTDLVTGTLAENGKSVTVNNLSDANQTVWIYVDENTDTKSRAAIVRVTYGADTKDFKIVQHGLFKVTGADSGRDYYIEQYEEYLYNYDAEDSYGQTKQEGMPWGLDGVQLSKTYYSFDPDLTPDVTWSRYESKATRPYYDFYIEKHDSFASENGGTVRSYPGQAFTTEIASNSNAGFTKLTLAESANSAVEYCYNRNKRDANGNVVNVEWYLPSADELEDFIVPAYSSFEEFQDNYYWTSQPAYIRNVFYYESNSSYRKNIQSPTVYDDNTKYARATKVKSLGNDLYEYAKSGLDSIPTPKVDNRAKRGESSSTNLGYFFLMHYWKGRYDYGPDKTNIEANKDQVDVTNGNYDEFFNHQTNGVKGKRYYVHLGHLDNMMQEGYHPRTKSNRVRCARKVASNN